MTKQEFYDRTRRYFTRPGARLARGTAGTCYYRLHTDQGTHACAIGCHIPDSLYDPAIEEVSVWNLPDDLVAAVFGDLAKNMTWLTDVQTMHDDADTVGDFLHALDAYADEAGLLLTWDVIKPVWDNGNIAEWETVGTVRDHRAAALAAARNEYGNDVDVRHG